MQSESSGKINYWPGFVDAFSNLVLALVFVIVILAMSLGMFSGLMAKMAIQRALIEQQLKDSEAAVTHHDEDAPAGHADAPVVPGGGAGATLAPAAAQSDNGTSRAELAGPPLAPAALAPAATIGSEWTEAPAREPADPAAAASMTHVVTPVQALAATALASAGTDPGQAALRHENEVLRREIAALRKQNVTLVQTAASLAAAGVKPGGTAAPAAAATKLASSGDRNPDNKFEPTMPEDNNHFNQRIETDLQRTLKEFEDQRDSRANINVVIHVPNYALTENKRTALFYLISIKDYLMKRKVSPDRIRMHMVPARARQKEMSVSISVKP